MITQTEGQMTTPPNAPEVDEDTKAIIGYAIKAEQLRERKARIKRNSGASFQVLIFNLQRRLIVRKERTRWAVWFEDAGLTISVHLTQYGAQSAAERAVRTINSYRGKKARKLISRMIVHSPIMDTQMAEAVCAAFENRAPEKHTGTYKGEKLTAALNYLEQWDGKS